MKNYIITLIVEVEGQDMYLTTLKYDDTALNAAKSIAYVFIQAYVVETENEKELEFYQTLISNFENLEDLETYLRDNLNASMNVVCMEDDLGYTAVKL